MSPDRNRFCVSPFPVPAPARIPEATKHNAQQFSTWYIHVCALTPLPLQENPIGIPVCPPQGVAVVSLYATCHKR